MSWPALVRAIQSGQTQMKYIAQVKGSWGDYTQYWKYLESVRHCMLPHIFEFASNPDNYDLASPDSLHDAWLESWKIEEIPTSRKKRAIQIQARFLGPMHDRYIDLTYRNVRRHEIASVGNSQQHGDLLVHELRVVSNGIYVHE